MPHEKILLKNIDSPNARSLAAYKSRGGYDGAAKALKMTPDELVEFVKKANLRGRGGAGFPAGMKWSFLPPKRDVTYLCVNADESEPPTFCNRVLMETDPHMVLEGTLIASYATRTTVAYIYMRGEFTEQFHIMQKALDEAYAAGYFGKNVLGTGYNVECYIHRGAGAYVCGEETGLIESLEGKRGWPRIKPPFPAVEGLFRKPTVVNNVETLACLPHILTRGVEWWLSLGTENSKGTKLYCVSGPVNRPGCYEAPLGITTRELIYGDDFGRGMIAGKKVKAVFPGGLSMGVLRGDLFPAKGSIGVSPVSGSIGVSSVAGGADLKSAGGAGFQPATGGAVIAPTSVNAGNPPSPGGASVSPAIDPKSDFDELDCKLDFDDVRKYGLLGLGTAAAVVVPEDADMRDVLVNVARFYAHESCGQCTQCREGTSWMYKIAARIRKGAGRLVDLDILEEVTANMGMMPGLSICGLPDGAVFPIRTMVQKFRKEFEKHIAAQPPEAAARHIKSINPAAYELPILGAMFD